MKHLVGMAFAGLLIATLGSLIAAMVVVGIAR